MHVWDLASPDPANDQQVSYGHVGVESASDIKANGRWLAERGKDKRMRVWSRRAEDSANGPLVLAGDGRFISDFSLSPDERWLATSGKNSSLRLWNLTAANPAAAPIVLSDYEDIPSRLTFCPNGKWLAATKTGDSECRLWNLTAPNPKLDMRKLIDNSGFLQLISFSHDGNRLVSQGKDNSIRYWDLTSLESENRFRELPGQAGRRAVCLRLSPDGKWLVKCSLGDNHVAVWNTLEAHSQVLPQLLMGHADTGFCEFSPDGSQLASAGNDSHVRLWPLHDEKALQQPVLLEHGGGVHCVAFSPNGQRLATGSDDGVLRLWDLRTKRLAALARAVAGRALTPEERTEYRLDEPQPEGTSRRELASATIHDVLPNWPTDAAWHKRQADECRAANNEFGARFHEERWQRMSAGSVK